MTNQRDTITLKTVKPEGAGYRTTMVSTYAGIARRHLKEAESMTLPHGSVKVSVEDLRSKGQIINIKTAVDSVNSQLEQQARADEHAHIAVVFAQMALEAYLYDYGTRKSPTGFFKKYLERLPFLDRMKAITEFATGKPFPTEGAAWRALTDLNKARNAMIHFKAEKLRGGREDQEQLDTFFWVEKAGRAIEALDEFVREMAKLDPQERKWLEHFKPGPHSPSALFYMPQAKQWVEWPPGPATGKEDGASATP